MSTINKPYSGLKVKSVEMSNTTYSKPLDKINKLLTKKFQIMAKQRKTSKKAGRAASKVLKDKRTGKDSKTAAGSALSQRAPKKKGKK